MANQERAGARLQRAEQLIEWGKSEDHTHSTWHAYGEEVKTLFPALVADLRETRRERDDFRDELNDHDCSDALAEAEAERDELRARLVNCSEMLGGGPDISAGYPERGIEHALARIRMSGKKARRLCTERGCKCQCEIHLRAADILDADEIEAALRLADGGAE